MIRSTSAVRVSVLPTTVAVAALALTSCAVGPDYRRPDVASPGAFKEEAAAPAADIPAVTATWWTLFNDPELTALVEKGLAANLDLQGAIARLEQSRAALGIARGDYFPAVGIDATARRSGSAATTTSGAATGGRRVQESFSLPLSLSYELDIWGRLRREVEAARNTYQASEADLEFVRQTVAADIAQAYVNVRLYDTQIGIYGKNLDFYRQLLELTQTKFDAGLSLQTDVLQAQTQVNSSQAQLLQVRRSRAKQEHAIAVLLGLAPSEFSLAAKPLTLPVPVIPAGVPAALLNRRPDVAQAERRLAAANAQVGVATAAFYPSFSLTGSFGFESSRLQNLTDWSNRVWSIGPSVNLPLFQGGRLRGGLEQSRATYRERVSDYRSAILTAYRDVEDQLSDLRYLGERAAVLTATLESAREYSRLTELQYRQGLVAYLQVIDANQTLLTNELTAAQNESERIAATILLIKALGGGWNAEPSANRG